MKTTPTTTEVLKGTQIQREGEYLLIKELGNMKSLVALGTARLVKFFIMHPATEMNDNCKMEQVYQAKRGTFCGRHIEFAIEYAESGRVQTKFFRNL